MPEYHYKATDISGKIKNGKLVANSPEQLKKSLESSGMYLIDYGEYLDRKLKKRLKAPELSTFCREISTMLGSGVSLVRALNIITQRDMTPNLVYTFGELNAQIKKGVSLSEAMELQKGKFPLLLINMVKSGEATGRLDDTMSKMADYFEKEHRLNKDIKSAMTYPIILACLTVLVVLLLFTFVIPTFIDVFEGMELPAITRVVLAISNFVTGHFLIVIGAAAALAFIIYILRHSESFMFRWDKFKLRIPRIGKLLKIIYTARFARTLSSLYSSGITIISALNISKETVGNRYITSQFDEVVKSVRAGGQLSVSLMSIDGFDKKLSQTIAVGEETGQLDALLVSIADSYDYESGAATKAMVTFIEPVMIAVMAVIVVLVMLSVMLPIYSMYSQVEQQGTVAQFISML